MFDTNTLFVLLTISLVTILIRFSPFVIFRKKVPKTVEYLSKVIPYAVIGMLVVYCYKDTNFESIKTFIPQLVAGLFTIAIHKLKHKTLLSIIAGTTSYILLVNQSLAL